MERNHRQGRKWKGRERVAQKIGIGWQDFEEVRQRNLFYVDKTAFIREWWESGDGVTLIARPRRFGKTLNMSMLEKFFSVRYAGRGDLFEGLRIWEEEKYRKIQGTYPVISLSFANVKERTYEAAVKDIGWILMNLYSDYGFLLDADVLNENEKQFFQSVKAGMDELTASKAIYQLSLYLYRYYGKKVIILLDEYDTPMQEAYVSGCWNQIVPFIRNLFNAAFKTNPYLERAVMTGITRVSKESIFSDLNNLEVVTVSSEKYADSFGFTEEEVFAALDEHGLSDRKQEVKHWYDGFTFGNKADIYNPWSIINYLDKKKLGAYWANTSSNSLVGNLIQGGSQGLKEDFETLLKGGTVTAEIDEQVVYHQLDEDEQAVWSLLLASGYLKVKALRSHAGESGKWGQEYELGLTNFEVLVMFQGMISRWFGRAAYGYNSFIKALLLGDVDAMNAYMNRVTAATFSYFDTASSPSGEEPERFYHGFVLGLMVDLSDRYVLTSNRESGFGRYDVMLEPRKAGYDGIILEFKVFQPRKEKGLEDAVEAALKQIEEKRYETALAEKGIPKERIRKYGFAFRGKEVLIGEG